MAPETHTRYRVQRLIRMGEWLERNTPALLTAFESLDAAHDMLLEAEGEELTPLCDAVSFKMMQPLNSLRVALGEVLCDEWGVQRGKDVTLFHPMAEGDKRYEVVMKAPTAKIDIADPNLESRN